MDIEYLAAFNLLIAALVVKVGVSPDKYLAKVIAPAMFSFIIVNAIALGSGLSS